MELLSSWKSPNDSFVATTMTKSKLEEISKKKVVARSIYLEIKKKTDLKILLKDFDAVLITVAPKQGAGYKETYLDTALSITLALKELNKNFFVLYTSSTSVYGDHKGKVIEETSDRIPLSEGSKVLSKVEDIFSSLASPQIEVCVIRLGGIYGPLRTLEQRARKISEKKMSGSGEEPMNYIHLEDIVNAIEFCLINRLSGIYNLVNNDHPKRKAFYNDICEQMNINPPIWVYQSNSLHNTNAICSNEKIKKAGYFFKKPSFNST